MSFSSKRSGGREARTGFAVRAAAGSGPRPPPGRRVHCARAAWATPTGAPVDAPEGRKEISAGDGSRGHPRRVFVDLRPEDPGRRESGPVAMILGVHVASPGCRSVHRKSTDAQPAARARTASMDRTRSMSRPESVLRRFRDPLVPARLSRDEQRFSFWLPRVATRGGVNGLQALDAGDCQRWPLPETRPDAKMRIAVGRDREWPRELLWDKLARSHPTVPRGGR